MIINPYKNAEKMKDMNSVCIKVNKIIAETRIMMNSKSSKLIFKWKSNMILFYI